MELLFEYSEYRCVLNTNYSQVIEEVQGHLRKAGVTNPAVAFTTSTGGIKDGEKQTNFFLQKWNSQWRCFVNIDSLEDIASGDRLTVVKIPPDTAGVEPLQAAATEKNQEKKQSTRDIAIDPSGADTDESSAVTSKGKGKAKKKRKYMVTVTALLLDRYQNKVPKGASRTLLEQKKKFKKLYVTKCDTHEEIDKKIRGAFGIAKYNFLECIQGGNKLAVSSNQKMDGKDLIVRRGCLYLCKEVDKGLTSTASDNLHGSGVTSTSASTNRGLNSIYSDDDDFLPPAPVKKKRKRKLLSSDETSFDRPAEDKEAQCINYILISDDSDHTGDDVGPTSSITIDHVEARMIRQQQDKEYERMLLDDLAKAKRQKRAKLQKQLKNKWDNIKLDKMQGRHITIRYRDSTLVTELNFSTSNALYEMVFAFNSNPEPFQIYHFIPRSLIPLNHQIEKSRSMSIVVEEDDEGPDPLTYIDLDQSMGVTVSKNKDSKEKRSAEDIIREAEQKRVDYVLHKMHTSSGQTHTMDRDTLYNDCLSLYKSQLPTLIGEYPFYVSFTNEMAVDTGGVARDMFSGFWEHSYINDFDGASTYVPSIHPHKDISQYKILGAILSHGYMSCGFLPVRVAFPVIAHVLLGMDVQIPVSISIDAFKDYVSTYESTVIRDALEASQSEGNFSPDLENSILNVLSNNGCREIPKPNNIQQFIVDVAHYEMESKPAGAVSMLHSGIPEHHRPFWKEFSVNQLYSLYKAISATPKSVVNAITTPDEMNSNQSRVFGYLKTFVGNLNQRDLQNFLRFVTGSSVMINEKICIEFDGCKGLLKVPTSRTCNCVLVLPSTFLTYPEFEDEFLGVLRSEVAWPMNII